MATLDGILYNGTAYDLGGGAELPYKKTEIALSPSQGRMTTGLTVFGTQYKYASLSVSSGQKYLVTGRCYSASLPCAFTVDSNNTVTKLLDTVNEVYEDAEITIPTGAVTLYLNSKEDNTISATLLDGRYTQQEFAEKIYEIDTLSDDVSRKADLTYELTPVEITVEQGWISTALATYGTGDQRHTSISVNEGEMYAILGGTSSATYPCAFCVDANNNVTVLNSDGYCFNKIVTIPSGAVTLYVNNNIADKLIGISQAVMSTQNQFGGRVTKSGNKLPNLKVLYDGVNVQIKRKCDAENDIVVTMGNTGPNNLFNFVKAHFVANTEDEPNDHFVGYTSLPYWTASSDCLGPYWVRAVNNIDGDYSNVDFTGGNHTNSGGAITATQQSLSILLNGLTEIEQNVLYSCERLVIRWTNLIQGYNTSKADGTGRGIMTESWEAVIDSDRVKLTNKITALENIIISRYYGFQINRGGAIYYFVGGANRKVYTEASGSGAGSSGNNTCRKAVFKNTNTAGTLNIDIAVDPVDLGLFAYNNGTSFFASNAKIYSNMIYDHELELSEGDSAFLEGYYRFY